MLCGGAPAAWALTIEVPPNIADSSAKCVASPCPNLRSAVALANENAGSTIELEAGTYRLTMGEVALGANTTVAGSGEAATRIVQTSFGSRVIEVEAAGAPVVTIEGLEVTGGELVGSPAGGGGVGSVSAGTLTLRNVLVDRNQTEGATANSVTGSTPGEEGDPGGGGGVYDDSGALVLDHVTVSDNGAYGGGGGNAQNGLGGSAGEGVGGGVDVEGGALTVENSTIEGNAAIGGIGGEANTIGGSGGSAEGAGVYDYTAAAVLIEDSTIVANKASGGGGGAAHSFGSSGGSGQAGRGGGLYLRQGVVENSTITGNEVLSGAAGVGGMFNGEVVAPMGGGLYVNALLPLTLASDTLDRNVANVADSGSGGNASVNEGTSVTLKDTILAAGAGTSGTQDCAGSFTDGGRNLEDRTPSQCGLSPADGDLLGASPLLGALAENGGPTRTLALGAASPALGTGGACTDPASGDTPLTADQRGLPRPAVCDIGAFEHQPPVNVAFPVIEGTPAVGKTLTCTRGTWSGDGTLTYAFQWLRDGKTIAGAAPATYVVAAADAGHQLGCQVTATNIYASVSANSAQRAVPDGPVPFPTITEVHVSHRIWREGSGLATLAHRPKRTPVGTAIGFTLNTPAQVTVAFTRPAKGRTVGHRCERQTARDRHARRCRRRVTVGTLAFAGGHAGRNSITFLGWLSARHKLPAGTYGFTVTAQNASGKTSVSGASFTIVKH